MRRRATSGLVVSELGLGSWLTLGRGIPREAARAVVERALELGFTLFDTSPSYDGGAAETFLGEVLAVRPRDSYVLATKVTASAGRPAAEHVVEQLEASLRRLRTDYVDLYQCHGFDPETLAAARDAVRAGKVRALGVSGWTPEQLIAATGSLATCQAEYSILHRDPERGLIDRCRERGIGLLAWSPLAQGVLTGKYRTGERPPSGTRADSGRMGLFVHRLLRDDVLAAVDRLRPIADGLGTSLSQLALSWVLREPTVVSALVGATQPEQLDENAAASRLQLDSATLAAIDDAVRGVTPSQTGT